MKTRVFLVALIVLALSVSVVFAAPKAEIWQDPDTRNKYLVDPVTKEKLSSSYESIHVDVEGSGNYVGLSLGKKELLNPYTGEPVHRFYHEEYTKDGLRIGELGSCKYILNPKTGKRMSSGYHEIHKRNGLLLGELGSMTYILDPKTKRRASKGYHQIYFQLIGERGATKEVIELK